MISRAGRRMAARSVSRHRLQNSSLAVSAQVSSSSEVAGVPQPTSQQLRILALRSAIPMVGFGIMDNVVMITAGEAIDASIGVSFGLSTLAAAGLGQCCSDVAGITSGGLVDACANRLRLPHHHLTEDQLDLKACRISRVIGSCVGVVVGCLLGMSVLLLMDTDSVERAKKAKELNSIFDSILDNGHNLVHAERATLWMLDGDELWSQVAVGAKEHVRVPKDSGVVGAAIKSGKNIIHIDAYSDEQFDENVDKVFGYRTKAMLTVLVKKQDGEVIGAIQMHNKINDDGTNGVFTVHDERMVEMLASHVATFILVVNGGD